MLSNEKPTSQESSVTYERVSHKGKDVIFIRFAYSRVLNERVKKLTGVHWSNTQKSWYVLDTPSYRQRFGLALPLAGKEVIAQIHPVNQAAFKTYIETLQLKAYSESTIRTYRNEFAQLLWYGRVKTDSVLA